jgi:DNA-binding LytR/AlgR family response regulator
MNTTKVVTAIVCDDEIRLARDLRDRLQALWPELSVVGVGHSGAEALALIDELQPDIAFLDIRMPGLSGLEVARQFVDVTPAPRFVFVTAYDEHAVSAFEARAVDYLLKPVKDERLAAAVARLRQSSGADNTVPDAALLEALKSLSTRPERKYLRWLNCGQGNEIDVISTSEVLFFQARDKYTAVITADKERYIRTTLRELLAELDPDEFWQVHRASVIRVSAIERVVKTDAGHMRVRLRGASEEVAVSAAFMARFRQM